MSTTNNNKRTITFVAKLRWVKKRPNEQMFIRNFEAHRLMVQSIIYEESEKWDLARAAKAEAIELLKDDLKDYMAGQQLTIPMATAAEGYGFGGIGGIM